MAVGCNNQWVGGGQSLLIEFNFQISAGSSHASAGNVPLPQTQCGATARFVPISVPVQYSSLRDVPCQAIHARSLVLNQFSQLIMSSWRLFSTSVVMPLSCSIYIRIWYITLSSMMLHTHLHLYAKFCQSNSYSV